MCVSVSRICPAALFMPLTRGNQLNKEGITIKRACYRLPTQKKQIIIIWKRKKNLPFSWPTRYPFIRLSSPVCPSQPPTLHPRAPLPLSPATGASTAGHRCLYPRSTVLLRPATAASSTGHRYFYPPSPVSLTPAIAASTLGHRRFYPRRRRFKPAPNLIINLPQ